MTSFFLCFAHLKSQSNGETFENGFSICTKRFMFNIHWWMHNACVYNPVRLEIFSVVSHFGCVHITEPDKMTFGRALKPRIVTCYEATKRVYMHIVCASMNFVFRLFALIFVHFFFRLHMRCVNCCFITACTILSATSIMQFNYLFNDPMLYSLEELKTINNCIGFIDFFFIERYSNQ